MSKLHSTKLAGEVVTDAKVIGTVGGTRRYPTWGCDIGFSLGPSDG